MVKENSALCKKTISKLFSLLRTTKQGDIVQQTYLSLPAMLTGAILDHHVMGR